MEKFIILFIYQLYANQATWTTTNDLMIKLKQLGSSWISKSVEKISPLGMFAKQGKHLFTIPNVLLYSNFRELFKERGFVL